MGGWEGVQVRVCRGILGLGVDTELGSGGINHALAFPTAFRSPYPIPPPPLTLKTTRVPAAAMLFRTGLFADPQTSWGHPGAVTHNQTPAPPTSIWLYSCSLTLMPPSGAWLFRTL